MSKNVMEILTEKDTITLGALADGAAIKQSTPIPITEDYRLVSSEYHMGFTGKNANEGPIYVGLADSELSVGEIAEALNQSGPVSRSDRLKKEKAERAVFLFGVIDPAEVSGLVHSFEGERGCIKRTTRWTFSETTSWCLFAYNGSGAALTTGCIIRFLAKHFGLFLS